MMHPEAMEWCERWASDRSGYGLDVGGRNVNGTARVLWPNIEWTVVDIEPETLAHHFNDLVDTDTNPHVPRYIQADARFWKPDRHYDVVLSTELLEHVQGWWRVIGTMVRALSPTGIMVITCAGIGRAPHSVNGDAILAEDEWYAGVRSDRLSDYLSYWGLGTVDIDIIGDAADVRAMARW